VPFDGRGFHMSKAVLRKIYRHHEERALSDVGGYVRAKAARYPPQRPTTTYRRTGTYGRSIAVGKVRRTGRISYVRVGTKLRYARYVEEGVGLYGPRRRLIRPTRAKVLAWRVSGQFVGRLRGRRTLLIAMGTAIRKGRVRRYRRRDVHLVFAQYSRGFPGWHTFRKAFRDPQTRAYFERRIRRMVRDVARAMGEVTR